MTRIKLKHAIAEAERFLKRAKELDRIWPSSDISDYQAYLLISGKPKITAVKRASMDLTRALADLRRKD